MDKSEILELIRLELKRALKSKHTANENAAAGATDSESRAETKWDTGGLEASYLARGYARQFEELAYQYDQLQSFEPNDFKDKPIGLGALVKCEIDGFATWFFLLPHCGGMELQSAEGEVTVITPSSPMARELMNKCPGAAYSLPGGRSGKILSVL